MAARQILSGPPPTVTGMTDIASRHRDLAEKFADLADKVTDWDAPTPVKEWSTRDIVGHLTSWLPGMLEGFGVSINTVQPGDDPAAAWREHSGNVQQLLEDEQQLARPVATQQGEQPLGQVLDNFYLADIFMHIWDLAKASGQDPDLDPTTVKAMVDGMTPTVEFLAHSGQFGTPRVLDETHSDIDRLVALIGRDPGWTRGLARRHDHEVREQVENDADHARRDTADEAPPQV